MGYRGFKIRSWRLTQPHLYLVELSLGSTPKPSLYVWWAWAETSCCKIFRILGHSYFFKSLEKSIGITIYYSQLSGEGMDGWKPAPLHGKWMRYHLSRRRGMGSILINRISYGIVLMFATPAMWDGMMWQQAQVPPQWLTKTAHKKQARKSSA